MALENRHLYKAEIVIGDEGQRRIEAYFEEIKRNPSLMGLRLRYILANSDIKEITIYDFIDALLKTKKPQVFAESPYQVKGNGLDWTTRELNLLGFMGGMQEVEVFATRANPQSDDFYNINNLPKVTFIFTNGALLEGCGADKDDVLDAQGHFDEEKYTKYFEDRLLPLFIEVNKKSENKREQAIITIPTLGGGQFAGDYSEEVNAAFIPVIRR